MHAAIRLNTNKSKVHLCQLAKSSLCNPCMHFDRALPYFWNVHMASSKISSTTQMKLMHVRIRRNVCIECKPSARSLSNIAAFWNNSSFCSSTSFCCSGATTYLCDRIYMYINTLWIVVSNAELWESLFSRNLHFWPSIDDYSSLRKMLSC